VVARGAIRDLTHGTPEFVFWDFIPTVGFTTTHQSPSSSATRLRNTSSATNPITAVFLRGRVVRYAGQQLIAVYCRSDALASAYPVTFASSLADWSRCRYQLTISALVVSDNADIYGDRGRPMGTHYSNDRRV
jgi:hypothetical protein